jgi:hypothetical protein
LQTGVYLVGYWSPSLESWICAQWFKSLLDLLRRSCSRHQYAASYHFLATENYTALFYMGIQVLMPQSEKCFYVSDSHVDVWFVPSTSHCGVHIEIITYFLVSEYLFPYFLKLLSFLWELKTMRRDHLKCTVIIYGILVNREYLDICVRESLNNSMAVQHIYLTMQVHNVSQWTKYWTCPIGLLQSRIFLCYILILFCYLLLRFWSRLVVRMFPTTILYAFHVSWSHVSWKLPHTFNCSRSIRWSIQPTSSLLCATI